MKSGNWVPLDKSLVKLLPKTRPYSYIEAMFSYTVDRDNDNEGSINGYAVLWGWSRNKVRKFINELRTDEGHIADRKGTSKGQAIRFINNNLEAVEDKKRTGKGQLEDNKRDTTIYPNTKPNPKVNKFVPDFESIWTAYPNKDGKKAALNHFNASVKNKTDWDNINTALKNYLDSDRVKKGYIKNGSTWFNNWKDWIEVEPNLIEVKDTVTGKIEYITEEEARERFPDVYK